MLPYFQLPDLAVYGAIRIKPFGLLVLTGMVLGYCLAWFRAKEKGIAAAEFGQIGHCTLGAGLFVSHLFVIFFSEPGRFMEEGWIVFLKFWQGMSSTGGLLGALLGSWLCARYLQRPWRVHADCLVQGWVLGWASGRLGCAVAHDHPGGLTDFVLGVAYPGGTRHNLGLYEFIYTLAVMLPVILLYHKRRPNSVSGTYVVLVAFLYCPFRFFLDFLRATDLPTSDIRYLGLTLGQYGALLFLALAAVLWSAMKTNRVHCSSS